MFHLCTFKSVNGCIGATIHLFSDSGKPFSYSFIYSSIISSYHFSCDLRFLHFEAPLALLRHGFARVWLVSICTRIGPWHAACLVFAQTFAHLIVQPHKEFETYLSQFLSWIYLVKCNSLMFCLKEHYLLSGNSRTYLRKPHQAVKTFCTQRPIDHLGETAFCVIYSDFH